MFVAREEDARASTKILMSRFEAWLLDPLGHTLRVGDAAKLKGQLLVHGCSKPGGRSFVQLMATTYFNVVSYDHFFDQLAEWRLRNRLGSGRRTCLPLILYQFQSQLRIKKPLIR